jgi:hypothetical protein
MGVCSVKALIIVPATNYLLQKKTKLQNQFCFETVVIFVVGSAGNLTFSNEKGPELGKTPIICF